MRWRRRRLRSQRKRAARYAAAIARFNAWGGTNRLFREAYADAIPAAGALFDRLRAWMVQP